MYKSEELLAKTRPYQVPLYEDKVIHEIFQAGGLVKRLAMRYDIYIFDDESIIANIDGNWQAYPPPQEQTVRYPGAKWQDHFICAACNCKIKERHLYHPANPRICGDCQFDREGDEYYGLRPQPKTLVEILKESSDDVPTLNLKESQ